ncbi:GDSL esterase/lipase At5g45910-like [Lycium ferocissimum]|uniref:GDSL esterase/lipase At5g45910-like n=1 Tax=Lycium ferocissimum TaxID=112874 RepID=UPI0028158A54|nr:GDSL esterase/lipase At5g45910-like [Lycium ferocissimum]
MFSKLHNDHLWQAIFELQLKYPDVHIISVDYYKAFMAVLKNHKCGEEEGATCSDRASYLHWDGFRLTPEALESVIDTVFSKKVFVFPEFKFGEETKAAITRHHSKIHRGRLRVDSDQNSIFCVCWLSVGGHFTHFSLSKPRVYVML